jgi:hypothetical protein
MVWYGMVWYGMVRTLTKYNYPPLPNSHHVKEEEVLDMKITCSTYVLLE